MFFLGIFFARVSLFWRGFVVFGGGTVRRFGIRDARWRNRGFALVSAARCFRGWYTVALDCNQLPSRVHAPLFLFPLVFLFLLPFLLLLLVPIFFVVVVVVGVGVGVVVVVADLVFFVFGFGCRSVSFRSFLFLVCSALLCFALLCFALPCSALLCFALPRPQSLRT